MNENSSSVRAGADDTSIMSYSQSPGRDNSKKLRKPKGNSHTNTQSRVKDGKEPPNVSTDPRQRKFGKRNANLGSTPYGFSDEKGITPSRSNTRSRQLSDSGSGLTRINDVNTPQIDTTSLSFRNIKIQDNIRKMSTDMEEANES